MVHNKKVEKFFSALAKQDLETETRAVAVIWFYTTNNLQHDLLPKEIISNLNIHGFPQINRSFLAQKLSKSSYTIRGFRTGSFRLNVTKISELSEKFSKMIDTPILQASDSIIPSEWVVGKRNYLEKLVNQINGSFDYNFYDCVAVLMRRLMESLIIETFCHEGREEEIKAGSDFIGLEDLINKIKSDSRISISRNSKKIMIPIKELGDTAAHDRFYVTRKEDIIGYVFSYKKLIHELLIKSGINI